MDARAVITTAPVSGRRAYAIRNVLEAASCVHVACGAAASVITMPPPILRGVIPCNVVRIHALLRVDPDKAVVDADARRTEYMTHCTCGAWRPGRKVLIEAERIMEHTRKIFP